MKVLQLIDSLDAGGAEQVAVLLANEFQNQGVESHICVTRKEGILKSRLDAVVAYLFLDKKKTLDWRALTRLKNYVVKNEIDIVHAHSTSFFLATLLKLKYSKIKIVWHTHLGARAVEQHKNNRYIKWCSYYFDTIITVNEPLKDWCAQYLKTKSVYYVSNGVPLIHQPILASARKKKIVCVANLKEPKNHLLLIQSFAQVYKKHSHWELVLIGQTFQDRYESKVRETIKNLGLEKAVQVLGQRHDVASILKECSIGVLSSNNEGLSMALLEYGVAGLAVVATDVGQTKKVVGDSGYISPPKDVQKFQEGLLLYIENEALRLLHSTQFQEKIKNKYSLKQTALNIITIYNSL